MGESGRVLRWLCAALVGAKVVASLVGCEQALGLDDATPRTDGGASLPDADGPALVAETGAPPPDAAAPDAAAPAPPVVSSLANHTCAVTAEGRAYCWGTNDEGQLGDGTMEPRARPVWVAPFEDVVDVSAGYTHSCLVRANSDVYCWGKNDRGQLGDGTKVNRREASVLTMSGATRVGVAGWHTCAVTTLRTVRCWGDNYYGALGDGTYEARTRPVDVLGLADVATLAVGVMHACAATEQGQVYCWGRFGFGAIGYAVDGGPSSPDPNDPGSPLAQRVPGLSDVVNLAAGEDHTCATRSDGKVLCWGRNDYAQLGDGTRANRVAPALVQGDLTYAVRLTAGEFNTCATFTGGRVRCWGRNNFGQLGNGNTTLGDVAPSPEIVWLSDVERLATGEHGCAWRKDRRLFCWGRNDFGQLGLGRVSDFELVPQEVTFPAPTATDQ
jgi:alpha-tubulin suppressor-like RCC1 family protein